MKNPFKDLGRSLLSGAWILFIAILISVVSFLESVENGNNITSPSEVIFYILFVLMVGLSEELLMRGTITRILAEKFGNEGKGMVISVLIAAIIVMLHRKKKKDMGEII